VSKWQRKKVKYDGSSLKANPTQVTKDSTLATQTKATATSQKVNKSQTPKAASTAHLLLLIALVSTSVIAIQQSRWINLLLDFFL